MKYPIGIRLPIPHLLRGITAHSVNVTAGKEPQAVDQAAGRRGLVLKEIRKQAAGQILTGYLNVDKTS